MASLRRKTKTDKSVGCSCKKILIHLTYSNVRIVFMSIFQLLVYQNVWSLHWPVVIYFFWWHGLVNNNSTNFIYGLLNWSSNKVALVVHGNSEKRAVMYLCVRGIDFVSFYDFPIGFWNCSDSVLFFVCFSIYFIAK
jgi:hypothetical protein